VRIFCIILLEASKDILFSSKLLHLLPIGRGSKFVPSACEKLRDKGAMATMMIGPPMAVSVIVAWCSGGLNGDSLNGGDREV
ncbi:hypothetical protein Tco_1128937, partial [Tanacetum coccineum]